MSIPELKTEAGTLFDYDLNIYRREEEVGIDEVSTLPIYDYVDPWYIDVYRIDEYQGATTSFHQAGPIELTPLESNMLCLGHDGTLLEEDDNWYGLWGFIQDYGDQIHPRVLALLNTLPKYTEEVLF